MKKEYDLSKMQSRKNTYASRLKKPNWLKTKKSRKKNHYPLLKKMKSLINYQMDGLGVG